MRKIHHTYVCGAIPLHILTRVAEHTEDEASGTARATLEHMRELATSRAATLIEHPATVAPAAARPRKRRNVYDAQHTFRLPGKAVMNEHTSRSADVEVTEAYDGSGATYDFFAKVFRRASIDGRGMRLDSTVHYGTSFENALWNGRQMVYGHADGRIFTRFTASVDVIGHELTHGVTQYAAALGYHGQTGALNEHLADAFGIMVKQFLLGLNANESDWLIGKGIFGPAVHGVAVRSMAAPGTAYDDPILGRDPQPSHMRDYVKTTEDNGGVHINSGILNYGFYLAAQAIGGKTYEVLGRVWYAALTDRLRPEADFADFVQATVDIAGELFGHGGRVQRIVYDAWASVGLTVPVVGCAAHHTSIPRPRQRAAGIATHNKRVSRKENT
jgi:Zn-dependent metalloprotease